MIDLKSCIRCNKETTALESNDAIYYDELLAEGIKPKEGDIICDECADELEG